MWFPFPHNTFWTKPFYGQSNFSTSNWGVLEVYFIPNMQTAQTSILLPFLKVFIQRGVAAIKGKSSRKRIWKATWKVLSVVTVWGIKYDFWHGYNFYYNQNYHFCLISLGRVLKSDMKSCIGRYSMRHHEGINFWLPAPYLQTPYFLRVGRKIGFSMEHVINLIMGIHNKQTM